MKKKRSIKKLITLLLAVLLVFPSMTVLAEGLQEEVPTKETESTPPPDTKKGDKVASSDASLVSIAKQTISATGKDTSISKPKAVSATVPESVSSIAAADIAVAAGATAKLYTDTKFSTEKSVTLNTEGSTQLYIKVTAGDSSAQYYNVTVTTKKVPTTQAPTPRANYLVTVQSDGNGTASTASSSVAENTEVTLTATPNVGYQFKEWEVIVGSITIQNNKFTMPAGNVEVKAIFELIPAPVEYSITVSDDGDGTGSADYATAAELTEVTLSATPNVGYQFKEWEVVTGSITIQNNKFTMPAGNVEVKANFELIPAPVEYSITVSNDGDGTGSADYVTAPELTEVTLSTTPNAGYQFKEWEVVTGAITIQNNKFAMPAGNVEVKAIFEPIPAPVEYSITVSNDGNGTGSADYVTAPELTEVTLSATPNAGYQFKEWEVVTGPITITSNKFAMPAWNVEVKAIFELIPAPTQYTITVQNDGTGTAQASQAAAIPTTEITLTATANQGYRFKEWQVVSGSITIQNNKFIMPVENVVVKAIFEQIPAPSVYSIKVSSDGNGTAKASHTKAAKDTEITLSKNPNSGYQFKEWQVVSGNITITGNKFIMPAENVTIKAIFEKTQTPPATMYAITVQTDGNGTAKANLTKAAANKEITLSATPNKDYRFKEWQVVSGTITIKNNKFIMPAEKVTVKAVFEKIPTAKSYTVTVKTNGNGTATADKTSAVAGKEITLTAKSNTGYYLKGWKIISGEVKITRNKFIMPASNVEIQAVFEKTSTRTTPRTTPKVTPKPTSNSKTNPAKTGDNSTIVPYILLMVVSAGGLGAVVIWKKSKKA